MLLLRLISFHVLIYASIELLLGMLAESTPTHPALAMSDVFLFRSLSFGVKVTVRCRDSIHAIGKLLQRMFTEQTFAHLAFDRATVLLKCRRILRLPYTTLPKVLCHAIRMHDFCHLSQVLPEGIAEILLPPVPCVADRIAHGDVTQKRPDCQVGADGEVSTYRSTR